MTPIPTHTFVLDIGRHCSINCKFCYYHHLGDLRKQGWKSFDLVQQEIAEGIKRGNNRVEITGGEPTLYPHIESVLRILSENKIKSCIITNGIIAEKKLMSLIDTGVDEFLISVHGTEEIHDKLTTPGARHFQEKTLKIIEEYAEKMQDRFRFNFVINHYNQHNILDAAKWMSGWLPTTVNWINMNPHGNWQNSEETRTVIADLRIVEPLLNDAVEYLDWVAIVNNIRYYPMCRIDEMWRKCICNDLHVMFDEKEWDYGVFPKTFEKHRAWGVVTSNNVEEKGKPCCDCDLQWICGGANKHFHKASNAVFGEVLIPQKIEGIDKQDFYYYRKDHRYI